MKFLNWNVTFLLFFFLPMMVFAQENRPSSFMVSTYNIRYDNTSDTINSWTKRKEVISQILAFHEIDIIGIQEGLLHQVAELDSLLPDHSYVGVGRDDGAEKGEYSPIFYNSNMFEVLESGTFWLSETPDKPSTGWDASYPRICTWAVLKPKKSSEVLFIFNTHFDHKGVEARNESVSVLRKKIKEIAENNPVILMGDFNSEPDSEVYASLLEDGWNDALTISENPHFGPRATYNDFKFLKLPKRRIDYIFVNDYLKVKKHAILNNHYQMKYPSDHFPVVAEIGYVVD